MTDPSLLSAAAAEQEPVRVTQRGDRTMLSNRYQEGGKSVEKAKRLILITLIAIGGISAVWSLTRRGVVIPLPVGEGSTGAALESLATIRPIDAHVHFLKMDPTFQAFLDCLHLTLLDILIVDDTDVDYKRLAPQLSDALVVVHSSRGHVALCTTFDPYKFNDPDFATEAIRQLDQNFVEGAVAVKLWKNVGMEIKNQEGAFVMPDDPKFEPIYRDIAKHGKTLLMHVADTDSCWEPLGPAIPSLRDGYWHNGYFKQNPQWYMFDKPDHPSKARILSARDRVLAQNPKLRVVGCHLGSMETNVDEIAKRFDRYSNFAVDTAARVSFLMVQPRAKVRAFLIKYQDRILYGTDLIGLGSDLWPIATQNIQEIIKEWERTYARDWRFFATDQIIDFSGKKIHGLKLPQPVLRKIFRENLIHWIPGIVK